MGFSAISGVYVYFFVPELKGRSLEELDYMFEARISTRQFKHYDSTDLMAEKRIQHQSDAEARAIVAASGDKKDEIEAIEKV